MKSTTRNLILAGLGVVLTVGFAVQDSSAQSRKSRSLSTAPTVGKFKSSATNFSDYSWGLGRLGSSSSSYSNSVLRSSVSKAANYSSRSRSSRSGGISTSLFSSSRSTRARSYSAPTSRTQGSTRSYKVSGSSRSVGKGAPNIPSFNKYQAPNLGLSKKDKPDATLGGKKIGDESKLFSAGKRFMNPGQAYVACFKTDKADAKSDDEKVDKSKVVKTLAPDQEGLYRHMMLRGEDAFKRQQYQQAVSNFKQVAMLFDASPESMLSLMHSYFATADRSYEMPAYYLQKALVKLPELLLLDIHPKNFYGQQNVTVYVRDQVRLENFIRKNPENSDAHLIHAYLLWLEGDTKAFEKAIKTARKYTRNLKKIDALNTMWDSALITGKVKGKLYIPPVKADADKAGAKKLDKKSATATPTKPTAKKADKTR